MSPNDTVLENWDIALLNAYGKKKKLVPRLLRVLKLKITTKSF